jgi:hypothetical protein
LLATLGLRFFLGSSEPRSLYSLRHYYANRQIRAKAQICNLARRMGTSVNMIELDEPDVIVLVLGVRFDGAPGNASTTCCTRSRDILLALISRRSQWNPAAKAASCSPITAPSVNRRGVEREALGRSTRRPCKSRK